ncbi:hypothetical protein LTR36_008938 [Oleoguttula mirabilis]|uniref:Uncharacterized protein n=1 Tax=Oleoguttula mirabilis TaxID=1507867 RepID=A0AAV9J7P5_9PEZI|nr:hypothetical protein LTR36_008938 [Oleoguttula mirabilis]
MAQPGATNVEPEALHTVAPQQVPKADGNRDSSGPLPPGATSSMMGSTSSAHSMEDGEVVDSQPSLMSADSGYTDSTSSERHGETADSNHPPAGTESGFTNTTSEAHSPSAAVSAKAYNSAHEAATYAGYDDYIHIHNAPHALSNVATFKAAMTATMGLIANTSTLAYEQRDEDKSIHFGGLEHTEPRVAKMEHSLAASLKAHSDRRMSNLLHSNLCYDDSINRDTVEEGQPMWSAVTHPAHGTGLEMQAYDVTSSVLGLNSSKLRKLWPTKVFPTGFLAVVEESSGGKGPAKKPEDLKACCLPLYGDDEAVPVYPGTLRALRVVGGGNDVAAKGCTINLLWHVFVDFRAGMVTAEGRMVKESRVRFLRAAEAFHREVAASYELKFNMKKREDARSLKSAEVNEKYMQPTWLDQHFKRSTRVSAEETNSYTAPHHAPDKHAHNDSRQQAPDGSGQAATATSNSASVPPVNSSGRRGSSGRDEPSDAYNAPALSNPAVRPPAVNLRQPQSGRRTTARTNISNAFAPGRKEQSLGQQGNSPFSGSVGSKMTGLGLQSNGGPHFNQQSAAATDRTGHRSSRSTGGNGAGKRERERGEVDADRDRGAKRRRELG